LILKINFSLWDIWGKSSMSKDLTKKMLAKVFKSGKKDFVCRYLDSLEMVEATCTGKLLKGNQNIVVGDIVRIEEDADRHMIVAIEERKNEIFRIIVRENKKKVVASNCDYLVIVTSSTNPHYKRGLVDRYLVRAAQWELTPLIVFNKMDAFGGHEIDLQFEIDRFKELSVDCFELSAKDLDYKKRFLKLGIEDLKTKLKGTTSIFLGQSGVGKSKLISALSSGNVQLKSREIGKVGKGTHTTTWSEIIDLGESELIDSPGIRSFSLDDIDPEELIYYFPDLAPRALRCKFNDCGHEENSKGCSFYVDQFDQEHPEVIDRLNSYKRIHEEVSTIPFWKKRKKS
jgi:ribosome biogenesis GTPase / thiamine phosphate phosphatase